MHLQVFLLYLRCCSSSSPRCEGLGDWSPLVKASREHPHLAQDGQQWGQAAHTSNAVADNFASSPPPSGRKGVKADGVESWGGHWGAMIVQTEAPTSLP